VEEKEEEDEREREIRKRPSGKGISVCMALKLINHDETASVIKTSNVGVYRTSYFIQSYV